MLNTQYSNLVEKHRKKFTRQQVLISDFIEEHMESVAFNSLKKFSEIIDVSTTSIIRFSRVLGLNGYKELQQIARQSFVHKESLPDRVSEYHFTDSLMEDIFLREIKNIEETMTLQDDENMRKVIETLEKSENVYILGMRSSFSLAYYFFSRFAQLKENVHLIQSSGMLFPEEFSGVNKNDCLVTFIYPRYSKASVNLLSMAKDIGTKRIIFTSKGHSELKNLGDLFLVSSVGGVTFKNTHSASICLIDYVVADYANCAKKTSLEQLKKTEGRLAKGFYIF